MICISDKNINNIKFYRYFLFTKFYTLDEKYNSIVKALNIKNKYKRIEYIYDYCLDYLDDYYSKYDNICGFKCNKCQLHREKNLDYKNGCCRYCKYQSNNGCTTRNIMCKLFNCSYVKSNINTISYNDLKIINVLDLRRQLILKGSYFCTREEVIRDLKIGLIFCISVKNFFRFVFYYFKYKKN